MSLKDTLQSATTPARESDRDHQVMHGRPDRACLDYHGVPVPLVCYLDDLPALLGCSRRSIERRRAAGTFLIPERASVTSRPCFSGEDVVAFLGERRRTSLRVAARR